MTTHAKLINMNWDCKNLFSRTWFLDLWEEEISPVPNLLIGHILITTWTLPVSLPAHLLLKCGMHSGRQEDWGRV